MAKRKEEEKTKSLKDESILSEVSGNLPALLEGLKITEKAASKGFEWENVNKVIDVVRDELNEVEAEITKEYKDKDKILDEVGDVLFSAINLARRTEVDPEIALKHANQKFRRRYGFVENKHKQNNLDFSNTSLDEKLKCWKEAKKEGL